MVAMAALCLTSLPPIRSRTLTSSSSSSPPLIMLRSDSASARDLAGAPSISNDWETIRFGLILCWRRALAVVVGLVGWLVGWLVRWWWAANGGGGGGGGDGGDGGDGEGAGAAVDSGPLANRTAREGGWSLPSSTAA